MEDRPTRWQSVYSVLCTPYGVVQFLVHVVAVESRVKWIYPAAQRRCLRLKMALANKNERTRREQDEDETTTATIKEPRTRDVRVVCVIIGCCTLYSVVLVLLGVCTEYGVRSTK